MADEQTTVDLPSIISPSVIAETTRTVTKGVHATVSVIADRMVIKVLGAKRVRYHDRSAALAAAGMVREYYERLRGRAPRLVPRFLDAALAPTTSGTIIVVLATPYCGEDMEAKIRSGLITPVAALSQVIGFLEAVYGMDDREVADIGIDPKPSNFCTNEDGLRLVDFIPPRYRTYEGTYLCNLPQPATREEYEYAVWLHYTMPGIVTNGFAQICRIAPDAWPECLATVRRLVDAPLRTAFFDLIEEASSRRGVIETRKLLVVRLAACRLAHHDERFRDGLERFFTSMRYRPGEQGDIIANAKAAIVRSWTGR